MGLGFKENGINLPLKKYEKPQPPKPLKELMDESGKITDSDFAMAAANRENALRELPDVTPEDVAKFIKLSGGEETLHGNLIEDYKYELLKCAVGKLRKTIDHLSEEELEVLKVNWDGNVQWLLFEDPDNPVDKTQKPS